MKALFASIFFFIAQHAWCQDAHFSMFSFATAHLNPSLTGVFDYDHPEADFRIFTNYRNQWRSVRSNYVETPVPFSSFSASSDFKLRWLKVLKYNSLGFGLMAFKDQSGDLNFSTTHLAWSLSFQKVLGRSKLNYLSIGIQHATVQRSIDFKNATFDNQWSGTAFDPSAPSGENLPSPQFYYQDVSIGLSFIHKPGRKNAPAWTIGSAVRHINFPNQGFEKQGGTVVLNPTYLVHGSAKVAVSDKIEFYPMFLGKLQGQASEITTTVFFGNKNSSNAIKARLGLGYRFVNSFENKAKGDAAIIALWFLYKEFDMGFSYDLNRSGLNPATQNRGGLEVFLIFHQKLDRYKSKYQRFKNYVPECPDIYDSNR